MAKMNITMNVPEMTIGIDVRDRYCHLCAIDRDGVVVEQGRVTPMKVVDSVAAGAIEFLKAAREIWQKELAHRN
jgi:hypothetical protein